MARTQAYAALEVDGKLKPFELDRRPVGPCDVHIDIHYCGICHTDVHMVGNHWGRSSYPLVPGHEIVGVVRAVGAEVKRLQVGQRVGVGCMVSSCRKCDPCHQHLEQHCEEGPVMTYGSPDLISGGITQGGYSSDIVVDEHFVLSLSDKLDFAPAAPLLCAGITAYSPIKEFGLSKEHKIGVIGLGGLGHMGVKLAIAFGAHVTVVTTSPEKAEDARRLGAHDVVVSRDAEQIAAHAKSLDFLLNTAPVAHDIDQYLSLLKLGGTMAVVGATPITMNSMGLIYCHRKIVGSFIGSIKGTQEMLDFCAERSVLPDIEIVSTQEINTAYKRLEKADVKYRFVIDMQAMRA